MKKKKTLASLVRDARERRGLSLRDIELLSEGEITNVYVSQIEIGKVTTPHPKKLKVISRVLQIGLLDLFEACGYLRAEQ